MKKVLQTTSIWWQKPQMRTDADLDIDRKTTWLELFWDLVFVGVLAELAQYLNTHQGWEGLVKYGFLFVPVWWIWNGMTFYNERYETNDVRHRLLTFLSMVPILGMAFTLRGAFDESANLFAAFHMASRLLLIFMWLSAGFSLLEKKLSRVFCGGLAISVLMFFASLFWEGKAKWILWGLAISVDLLTPVLTIRLQQKLPRISRSHLPERFGLLVILALGESVLSGSKAMARQTEIPWVSGLAAFLGLCISFLIWWIYTDHVLYRVFKPHIGQAMAWCYLHLPLAAIIIAISVLIQQMVGLTLPVQNPEMPVHLPWYLAWFLVAFLGVISMMVKLSDKKDHQYHLIKFDEKVETGLFLSRVTGAIFILLAGVVFQSGQQPLLWLTIAVVGLIIPTGYGLQVWVKAHLKQMSLRPTEK